MYGASTYEEMIKCDQYLKDYEEKTGGMMTFKVDLVVKKKNPASRRLSLTMDFTFNKLR